MLIPRDLPSLREGTGPNTKESFCTIACYRTGTELAIAYERREVWL